MDAAREVSLQVVRDAPLVSIDLIVRDPEGRVLLGLRNNEPARGCWFVPGGCIRKDERIEAAFARIAGAETGLPLRIADADLLGVYEHFYPTNFAGAPGVGTHYVVLAYRVRLGQPAAAVPDPQHGELRWWDEAALLDAPDVHANVKAYFSAGPGA